MLNAQLALSEILEMQTAASALDEEEKGGKRIEDVSKTTLVAESKRLWKMGGRPIWCLIRW